MPPTSDAAAAIEAAVQRQQWPLALHLSNRLLAESPGDPYGVLGRARRNVSLGRYREADADMATLLTLAPDAPLVLLMAGMIHHHLGRSEQAVAVLTDLLERQPPNRAEAAVVLAEALHMAGRRDELAALMKRRDAWGDDPRAVLFRAHVLGATDPDAAIAMLEASARGDFPQALGRINGFAAVELLDRAGRYREAFDLARFVHARFTPPFDLDRHLGPVHEQRALLAGGMGWCRPRTEAVQGVALVVGLPRSGTTLLEQMLDAHPAVSGIGEYEGLMLLEESLVNRGAWPAGLDALDSRTAAELQERYLRGALASRRQGAEWLVDKGLGAWRLLPAVAAVLPGAGA
jgi:tetratricopeptide (TPR) repeat protein